MSGQDASADLVGNFLTISNIAGFDTLRMDELWLQQNLLDDRISIRLGQIRADTEFVISEASALFLNATLGFPALLYTNLPDGGPVYPMGTLGIRLAFTPVKEFTFQTAIFEGNKFAQNVNRHGFRYSLNPEFGYFWINEAQLRWSQNENSSGLAGTFRVERGSTPRDFPPPLMENCLMVIMGFTLSWIKFSIGKMERRNLARD